MLGSRRGRPSLIGRAAQTAARTAVIAAHRHRRLRQGRRPPGRRARPRAAGARAAAPPAAPGGLSDEAIARLQKLAELHAAGILTAEEFAAQKAHILGLSLISREVCEHTANIMLQTRHAPAAIRPRPRPRRRAGARPRARGDRTGAGRLRAPRRAAGSPARCSGCTPPGRPSGRWATAFRGFLDPARLVFARTRSRAELLWAAEEALAHRRWCRWWWSSCPSRPASPPVRRLHLAAETGALQAADPPLALLLTPGDGGAPGIETRWHLAPAPGWAATAARAGASPAPAPAWPRRRAGRPGSTRASCASPRPERARHAPRPSRRSHLPAYADALGRGWSPDTLRPEAADEQLGRDPPSTPPPSSPASTDDDPRRRERHPPRRQPGAAPALAGPLDVGRQRSPARSTCAGRARDSRCRRTSSATSATRWSPGSARRGYATRALALLLPEARARGLACLELTTEPENLASRRVIETNGGVLVERIEKARRLRRRRLAALPHRPLIRIPAD